MIDGFFFHTGEGFFYCFCWRFLDEYSVRLIDMWG